MTPEQITAELKNCKTSNRYLTDVRGDRFWVFGLPTGELLVRRCVDGVMKPVRTMQYDEVVSIEGMILENDNQDSVDAPCEHNDTRLSGERTMRATSVKTLMKIAGELHAAYTNLTAFDAETKRIEVVQPITFNRRARTRLREQLSQAEEELTGRLALAIDKSTPERVDVACKACGEIAYVFDGF